MSRRTINENRLDRSSHLDGDPLGVQASDGFESSRDLGQNIFAKDMQPPLGDLNRHPRDFTEILPVELSAKIFLDCLPVPPLLEIFEHADLSEIRPRILKLGSVCQSWRTLAWSTPELWETLAVDRLDRVPALPIEFIEAFLHRSGGRPLNISLRFNDAFSIYDEYPQVDETYIPGVLAAICRHARRWKILHVRAPHRFISAIEFKNVDFPHQMTCLILDSLYHDGDPNEPALPLMRCSSPSSPQPAPSRLALYYIDYQDVALSFERLTHFDTGYLNPIEFISILGAAPQLRSMSCAFKPNTGDNGSASLCQMISSHHLQSLKLGHNDSGFDVLAYLTLPVLDHLECWSPTFETLKNLFIRSRCVLDRLLLHAPVVSGVELLAVLCLTPDLRELIIEYCPLDPTFFQRLWRNAAPSKNESVFLPQLQVFHYTASCLPCSNVLEWSYLSAKISGPGAIESQRPNPITLVLEAVEELNLAFDAEDCALLLGLMEDGVALHILDPQGEDVISKGALGPSSNLQSVIIKQHGIGWRF